MSRSGEPRMLGLDAPEAMIREDRGESDYMKNHPITSSEPLPDVFDHSSCHHNSIFEIIERELENASVYYPPDSHSNFYIPRHKLECIMTQDRISQVINKLECCNNLSQDRRRDLMNRILPRKDVDDPPCWKLLVVLISIGKQEKLLQFVDDEGVTDHCLPFKVTSENGSQTLARCRIRGHNHPNIEKLLGKSRCDASKWSYAVKAIYFTSARGKHNHYILETNDVLPITKVVEDVSSPDAPAAHQNEPRVISSGYSEVLIVALDESHYDFSHIGSWDPDRGPRQFALKKLHSSDHKTFNAELAALLRAKHYFSEHLIKVVATFEVQHSQGKTYHFLFPCALGDLWFFWKKHSHQDDRLPRAPWMARQLHGLAEALMLFHNGQDLNDQGVVLFGRHGDVKAENVLWFGKNHPNGWNATDWLVITDFGLGCLNSMFSRSGVDPNGVSRTATYRSPEFDLRGGGLSRVSDIFSFGCMCLEFVTWYLMGWEAVSEEFVQARMETDPAYGPQFAVDTFFSIIREHQENGNSNTNREEERAIIKPKVTEWIKRLRASEHSSCYTLQFLDLIEEKMLEPDPGERIRSDALVGELRLLADTCERNPTFYTERRNEPLG